MVTGFCVTVLGAVVGAPVAAGAVEGLGVVEVEEQALTVTMVNASVASALKPRLGLTVISSLILVV